MPKLVPVAQSAKNLTATADALAESAEGLRALAAAMQGAGFDSLEVTNYDQLQKALEYLERYKSAVNVALRRAKIDRGDFRSESPKPAEKTRQKRGA